MRSVVVLPLILSLSAGTALAVPPEAWLDRVTDDMRRGEYHLSAAPDGAWTAPNRAQGLRGAWSRGRLAVTPREDAGAWRFTSEVLGAGRGGGELDAAAVDGERIEHGRIEWTRGNLVEWYLNDERGVEQGFVVASRPDGDPAEPLVIASAIDGLLAFPAEDGASVMLKTAQGEPALRLSGLKAWDAGGRDLPAHFDADAGVVRIVVDDSDASYPVTIDPLLGSAAWNVTDSGDFGVSAATAGDVNGDGFSDVIVGAPLYDDGQTDEGRASVYLGSASGLAATPAWTAESNQAAASFGASVSFAGDVNGDGFGDVIVGAPLFDGGQADEGRAFVYLGSASGLATSAAWTAEGNQAAASYGTSVSTAGDVNGDGYADVIVGAPLFDNGQADEGRAFAYLGSASGLVASPAWTAESNQAAASFGASVSAAGDVNGDGLSDVIVGAPRHDNGQTDEGRASAFLGTATGLAANAQWTAESNQISASFGASVATSGDVNGDGYADVIVGAPRFDNGQADEGRAFSFRGSAAGLAFAATWTAESNQASASFGASVSPAGDVNGDGFADVLVGAPDYDNGQANEGRAYSFLGGAAGLATTGWTAESDVASAAFGIVVAPAGDVDGDGFSDAIVGGRGRASAYRGAATHLAATEAWTARGNQGAAAFGTSVASAGDVNGDGYSDVIVGAPLFDNGQVNEGRAMAFLGSASGLAIVAAWTAESNQAAASFGSSVACAGDVNGDGYSDVVVGAPAYDNGQADEGRAFAYMGSATGLATTASWTAESNQAAASFGSSVSAAGDVNGDGYGDVVIGAPLFDQGQADEGLVFVFHGAAAGLAATASTTHEIDQAGARFGSAVAHAGDLDRDGYGDVVVGAPLFDNDQVDEGRVFLFRGRSAGLAATANRTLERGIGSAAYGAAVASAGDVNGDGFSDLVVGSPDADNGQADEGRAYVYLGATPLSAMTLATTVESDQASASFGAAVGAAGDVNGDGYGDVLVGAPRFDNGQADEGRASLYLGSASGMATTPAWTAESNQAGAACGTSVAGAGDVNGDGYADAIVGSRAQDLGFIDEGRAFVYYGNAGDGLDRIARAARLGGSAPLDLMDAIGTNAFQARSNLRTPFGRGRVRLELEIKTLTSAFAGTGLRRSALTDTGAPGTSGSVVPLSWNLPAISATGVVKWRARLRADAPYPWTSHWMGSPRNAITECDLRIWPSDLKVSALTAPATSGAGKTLTSTDTTQNAGSGTAAATTTRTWISLDDVLDVAVDTLLGSRAVPQLDPAATSAGTTSVTIPANWPTGTSWLIAQADGTALVTESSETNNARTRSIAVGPDLKLTSLIPPATASSGATISIGSTTRNAGGGDAPPSTTGFWLSRDAILDGSDVRLGARAIPALAPATNSSGPTTVVIPGSTTPGTYLVIGNADDASIVAETDETANTRTATLTIDCHGETTPSCDDGNGCTDDWCDPGVGCVHGNNTARCDDGDACTGCARGSEDSADICLDGTCGGVPRPDCPYGCEPGYPWFGCKTAPDPAAPCGGLCPEALCCGREENGDPETCLAENEICRFGCLHGDPGDGDFCGGSEDPLLVACWTDDIGYPEVLTENPCVQVARLNTCGLGTCSNSQFCCGASECCDIGTENCLAGECVPTCNFAAGETACGDTCCADGETCVGGTCEVECGSDTCGEDEFCCGGVGCCEIGETCYDGFCLTSSPCAPGEEWMSSAQWCCPSEDACGHLENGEPAACCTPLEHCDEPCSRCVRN